METISAFNIHVEADYSDLGDFLFTRMIKGHNDTFIINRNDILCFNINKSSLTMKIKYIYNITDILNKVSEICYLGVLIQRMNINYKRFNITATLSYSGNSMSNEYIELFFSVKDIKYEEL